MHRYIVCFRNILIRAFNHLPLFLTARIKPRKRFSVTIVSNVPMKYFCRVNPEQQFIEQVVPLFMRFGIKSLTMDDIARQLGVSKKTIYKYVTDKTDLVRKAVEFQSNEERDAIERICEKDLNAIDQLFEISKVITNILSQIHPSVHYDLEKYYPDVWSMALKQRQEQVFSCIYNNLEIGKSDGLYRDDLNGEIIAQIYMAKIDQLIDGEIFPPHKFNFADVYLEFFRYHIRGIASPKGLKYLIEKVKKETENR